MRLIVLLVASLIVVQSAAGQKVRSKPLIYANLKGYFGELSGGDVSVAVVLGNRHEIGIGYESYFQDARNKPGNFFCWECGQAPGKDKVKGGILSYGYVFHPNFLKGYSRIVLRMGVLAGNQTIPGKFVRIPNTTDFERNYTYELKRSFEIAWMINPSLDIGLGKYVGLSIGPFGLINSEFASGGISFGLMLGKVADVKEAKKDETQKEEQ
jgi:hypothetical protein